MEKENWTSWWNKATNIYASRFTGDGPFSLLDMEVGKQFYEKGYTPEYYVDYDERKQKLRKEGFMGMNIGDTIEHISGQFQAQLEDFFESDPCGYNCVCVKTDKGPGMAHHYKKVTDGKEKTVKTI